MMVVAVFSLLLAAAPPQECTAPASAAALDHVILVVRDLDAASAAFTSRGFTLKHGRLHRNNLLNRHIKFRDGSSLELMTVRGTPRDAMARDYARLAAEGEGGVYVALAARSLDVPKSAAAALGLTVQESTSGPWRFLSFPPTSPAAALFFGSGPVVAQDPDSLFDHVPAVEGMTEAWLEGGAELAALLERLGAVRCGTVRGPDGLEGERIALSRGRVVIVPAAGPRRPRVLGVVLKLEAPGSNVVRPHPQFWVRYAF